jgi:hypothetical protein
MIHAKNIGNDDACVESSDGCENDDDSIQSKVEFITSSTREQWWSLVFNKGILSWCMLAMPLSLYAVYYQWNDCSVFWLSFIALVPLASLLSNFTEEVALHTNEITGGLINASFGNTVEVIVAIPAFSRHASQFARIYIIQLAACTW